MSEETKAPPRPTFVNLTNAQQERIVAALQGALVDLAEKMPGQRNPAVRATIRAEMAALREDIATLTTPRCTIVTPAARRQAEEDPT